MSRTAPAAPERPATLSLIISSLDEGAGLHETLRSVFAGSGTPAETVVVDDGGSDGSCAVLERDEWRARGVRVHHTERRGVAAARNTGARLSQGTYLLFLDAHCRLERDCLARLHAALTAEPGVILAPALCDVGSTAYGCGARLIDAGLRVRWLPPGQDGAPYSVPLAPGGCLALSRATFDHLNGFGVFRELGLEDVDFGLRAWRAGVDVRAVPSARLTHRFRPNPPYRLDSASRSYNVARVALIHFSGDRRAECLRRIIGTPRAAEVLVDAFCGDWEEQRDMLAATSVRSIEQFFALFGDWT